MFDETKSKLRQVCSFEGEIGAQETSLPMKEDARKCCSVNAELNSFYDPVANCDAISGGTINGPALDEGENYGPAKYAENYGTFPDGTAHVEHKVYPIRYLMLVLFSLCSMMNGFQWIQYSVITSIISCYYDVSVTAVNWTSVIFMVMYIPVSFPVMRFMNEKGLRFTLILGAAGNCLSSCVQCLSLAPNRFYVVIIAQLIASISQCFTLSVPPFIAALWFGSEEVSMACSVGVFGNQLGVALGFLVPSVLVSNNCLNKPEIRVGLMNLAFVVTVMNAVLFLAVMFVFEDKPKKPPSIAESRKHEKVVGSMSLLKLMKSTQFLLLFFAYGLLSSAYFAMTTLLNQMVVKHFPGREADAGRMGLVSILTGMVGAIVCGYFLDKTHLYRLTSIAINFLSFVSMVAYTVLMRFELRIWIQYVMIAILGFFVTGYLPVGFEIGAETTYPEPEGTSASLLNLSVQIFGIIMTMFGSWLLQTYGDLISNSFFSLCMLIGFILTVFIKCDLKRRKQYGRLKEFDEPS